MSFAGHTGETLDDKYRIERELGRGGMGTVYLATHLGTERPVAVKIIAPQYMQRLEFVERFRREARAAGRLRHPNVVDVTDFGFSDTKNGRVAYLVMEYLDGCTLGEILEEEKNLPVKFTLDILEQVCSAVNEAHVQGIIHRDLKPDNIWLEPNQRGGYTVKVLDFGIAKLEENSSDGEFARSGQWSRGSQARDTVADVDGGTVAELRHHTMMGEAATIALDPEGSTSIHEVENSEARTAVFERVPTLDGDIDTNGTKLIEENGRAPETVAKTGSDLTRVGAVLGTPLYMSPEQCRGEKLDARSDIYSLGVIAYQMLSGDTPFSGDYTAVMQAHKEIAPRPLVAKKVRRKTKNVVSQALSKDPADRPRTAEAFASEMRAQSEGIGQLVRRAIMLYTEHFTKFLGISLLLYIPFFVTTLLNIAVSVYFVSDMGDGVLSTAARIISPILNTLTGLFCSYLVVGTITYLVNQILAYPLRPVSVWPSLSAVRKNWKRLTGTGILSTVLTFLGYCLLVIPGVVLSVFFALVAPVVMMENLKGFAALRRSKELTRRSLRTTVAAVFLMFVVPLGFALGTSYVVAVSIKAFTNEPIIVHDPKGPDGKPIDERHDDLQVSLVSDKGVVVAGSDRNTTRRVHNLIQEGVTAILMLPFQVLIASLSSIIGALLYMKTRQVGGESMNDLLLQFGENDQPRKKWQERVRQRLIQSGRVTSKP